ncbi:MAG: hypothetical protein DRI97_06315, partial [Bacteroidetes bacterium]
MAEAVYFEEHGIFRHQSPDWEKDLYGFYPNGIGDAVSNMGEWTVKTGDPFFIPIMYKLLMAKKRWPDACNVGNEEFIATKKLQYGWSKTVHWFRMLPVVFASDEERGAYLKKVKPRLFRTQHGMTRDPYTWYNCAVIRCNLSPGAWIEPVDMPRYLRRRGNTYWRNYLITGNVYWKEKYEKVTLRQLRWPRREYALD